VRDVGPVEAQHVLARLGHEPVAHGRVREHERHHLRERARVARGEAQADVVVGDDLAQAAGVGHDARAAARHRLERDEAERLVQRRHDAEVGDPVQRVQEVVADPAEERAVRVEAEPPRLRLELRAVRPRAGDEEPHAPDPPDHAGQRVERDLEALLVHEPAGEQHEPLVGRRMLRAQRGEVADRAQVARVDAVRHDRHGVLGEAEDVGDVAAHVVAADDDAVRPACHPRL
jgi:hypothetical protein